MPDTKTLFLNHQAGSHLFCSEIEDWQIHVSAQAGPSERYAAEEFQYWFEVASGNRLTLTNTKTGDGQIQIESAEGFTGVNQSESFQIEVAPDLVKITGQGVRGTLYGVYQFLEDGLGVRFLTADHTHVPNFTQPDGANQTISPRIPCGRFQYQPPFSFRWSYYKECSDRPEFAARLRVNTVTTEAKLGGKTPQNLINHSFHSLLPFSQYGDDHLEFYALVDGERDRNTHGGGPQLCVTNPEVIRITTESVIRQLHAQPELKNISVSQADTGRYCRCDNCEAINQQQGTPMGSQLAFVNSVAEKVELVHPEVKVGTLAYWYTRQAPKTTCPRQNVQVQLCSIECCTLHAIDDPNCSKNRAFCQDMDQWGQICDDIWVWNYNTNFKAYDLPFPNLRSIGPNVRYFLRNNAKGLFMQANGNGNSGELCDLRNHLISRLIWNPTLDDRKVLEEFADLHYQQAAPSMIDYIDLIHDNAEATNRHPGCFPSAEEVGLTPEIVDRSLEHFDQAMAQADNATVRQRVEKASICVYRARIETAKDLTSSERKDLIEQYISLCQKHGQTRASEHKEATVFFDELRSSLS